MKFALFALILAGACLAEFSQDTETLLEEMTKNEEVRLKDLIEPFFIWVNDYTKTADIAARQDLTWLDRTHAIEDYWKRARPYSEDIVCQLRAKFLMSVVKRIEPEFRIRYGANSELALADFLKNVATDFNGKVLDDKKEIEAKKKSLDEKYGYKTL